MNTPKYLLPVLVLTLAGCAVGPDYETPTTTAASIEASSGRRFDHQRIEIQWWSQFQDPVLDKLVARSLEGNKSLRIAFARLKTARAIRDDVSNDAMPVVTSRVSSDIGRAQEPGEVEHRVNQERYDLGLDMAWEVDLFGRIRRELEASEADEQIAEADLYDLQVTMIAELVDCYGVLRGAQLRERIARDNLDNQQESSEITQHLRDDGVGNELDVVRADARLAAVEAMIPQLQAEQVRAKNRIATILGDRPGAMTIDLSPSQLPAISKPLAIGDTAKLLQNRPDVASAERQLAAQTARIGVQTADLFPRVTLSGFLGFTAGRGSQLGSGSAQAWGLGPSITWAAFDLGSVRARIRGANAEAEGALANYEQRVLLALEEAENAFSDYGKRQQRLVSLIRQSESSRAAAALAAVQYREGTADFLVLLDAERERLAAEDAQARAETEVYQGIVVIYKSLGGGWSNPSEQIVLR